MKKVDYEFHLRLQIRIHIGSGPLEQDPGVAAQGNLIFVILITFGAVYKVLWIDYIELLNRK
jgi:hypothetical protein